MSILINGLDMPSDDGELVEVLIFGDGHVVQTGDSFKAEDGRFYYKPCDWKYLTAVPVVHEECDNVEPELKVGEWIPVTERLPEHEYGESNSVLTVDLFGVMRVAYFDGGNWCCPSGEALTTMQVAPITHWMPLPQPPKEVEEVDDEGLRKL